MAIDKVNWATFKKNNSFIFIFDQLLNKIISSLGKDSALRKANKRSGKLLHL